jgi:hypothetical protein
MMIAVMLEEACRVWQRPGNGGSEASNDGGFNDLAIDVMKAFAAEEQVP